MRANPTLHERHLERPFTEHSAAVSATPFLQVHMFPTKMNTRKTRQLSFCMRACGNVSTNECTRSQHGSLSIRCCTTCTSKCRSQDTQGRLAVRRCCKCKCSLTRHHACKENTVELVLGHVWSNAYTVRMHSVPAWFIVHPLLHDLHLEMPFTEHAAPVCATPLLHTQMFSTK